MENSYNNNKFAHINPINKTTFVFLDCETTGLDTENDTIIEIAIAVLKNWEISEKYETIINPGKNIPTESTAIHGITNDMVKGKPYIKEIIQEIIAMLGHGIIVGHNISFDIKMVQTEAKRCNINWSNTKDSIDTLRLARFYGGKQANNSLKSLCEHFDINIENHHRAMSDVQSTIELFKELSKPFKTIKKLRERLANPIEIKIMPLGKYKGHPIRDLPVGYIKWAMDKGFDRDLHFSLSKELKRRNRIGVSHSNNPFFNL